MSPQNVYESICTVPTSTLCMILALTISSVTNPVSLMGNYILPQL